MRNFYIKLMFLVVVMVLVAVSLMTYRNLNNYIEEVNLIRHSREVFRALDQTLSTIKDAEIGHHGFQLTRDTLYLEPYFHSVNTIPGQLRALDSLVSDNEVQSQKVDTLKNLINHHFALISKMLTPIHLVNPYTNRDESSLLLDGRNSMEVIRAIIKRISAEESRIFEARVTSETDFRNIAPIALLFYTLIALGGVALLFSKVIDALDKQRIAEGRLNENILALKSEVGIREFTQKTLRSVLDNSLDGIMAFRAIRNSKREIEDFEWTLSNSIGSKSLGKSEMELVGKRLLDIAPEIKGEGLFDIYKEVVRTGHSIQFEKMYQQNPELYGWYHITVVKLEDGFVLTYSNITNQKKQRLILEERGLLLKEAETLANMGSWKWDESNKTLLWSDGLCKMLGKDPETFIPSWDSFLENVYSEDYNVVKDFLSQISMTGVGVGFEYRILLNGALKHISFTSKSRDEMSKTGLTILGTVIDITNQKMYETQLKKYTMELQRSNEDLEQFAYVASHDLQEPLRKIRAFGDRLTNRYKEQLAGQGEDYIQRMQSAASRMQTLIEDLLSFSRVSRSNEVFQPLDMNLILLEVLDDLDVQIRREGASIEVEKIPGITGEKIQVKRLFQNLLNNAIKFHKPNQKPHVCVYGMVTNSAEVQNQLGIPLPDVPYVRIGVKDDGIGFEEKYNERVFNLFQRLHGRAEYEGTGIGLAICKKIVANHKGYITARGKENVGSEFIVILPVS